MALSRSLPPFALSLALLALAAVPLHGQDAESTDGSDAAESSPVIRVTVDETETASFDDAVDVRLVNVEVYVTDRDGEPVTGLEADDFEVFEDARPVEITHFAERRGAIVEAPLGTDSRQASLPYTVEVDDSIEPEDTAEIPAEPTFLVVYFDNSHLRAQGRRQLIDDLQAFLAETDIPYRQVLIASQTPGLHAEAPFGSSRAELIDALQRIDTLPAQGSEVERELQLIYWRLNETWEAAKNFELFDPCEELVTRGVRDVANHARIAEARTATTLRHLTTLTSALAGVPGVKHLLYAGEGLQLQPGADLFEFIISTCPQRRSDVTTYSRRFDFTRPLEHLTRHANANRVSISTLDVAGLRTGSRSSVAWTDFEFSPDATIDSLRVANLRDTLNFLSHETGGRAIFDHNRFVEPLGAVATDMSNYYSLAYQPDHYGDDETYLIDVRLKDQRKYRVRHRMSYRDKPADERMADRLQSALTLGLEENPLGARMDHGKITETAKDTFLVPVSVTVPLDQLVFLPKDGTHEGRLRLQFVARDTEGRATAFHQKQFTVALDPSLGGVPEGDHSFVIGLEMRGGEHVVAVGLRDEIGRETAYLAEKLVVAPTPPEMLASADAAKSAEAKSSADE